MDDKAQALATIRTAAAALGVDVTAMSDQEILATVTKAQAAYQRMGLTVDEVHRAFKQIA